MESHIPSEMLQPFVKAYRIIESRDELVNRILPDTSVAIAFRFRGQTGYVEDNQLIKLPSSVVTGLRKTVRLIHYNDYSATIVVQLSEAGAAAFFATSVYELFGQSISLDNFVPQQPISILEEQLSEAGDNTLRIALIEQFLLSQLYNRKPDKLVLDAIERIRRANGIINIKALTDLMYLSQDAFEKRFRRVVGTSPKQFSSILRMQSIVHSRKPNQNFTQLAFDAGYFDQPHFNKEFKLFTGQSPTDFFKASSFW